MKNICQFTVSTVAFASLAFASQTFAADAVKEPSGAAFAHTCAACHGTYGYSKDNAFPGLAGMQAEVFVREMKRFRTKERPSSIMSHIADGYNDAELERMAQFFAQLPKTPEQSGNESEGAGK